MAKSKASKDRPDDRGTFSGQLREIIASRIAASRAPDKVTVYSLEMVAAIPRGALSRFMDPDLKSGLTTKSIDKLAQSLGLRLIEVERRKGNRKPRAATAQSL